MLLVLTQHSIVKAKAAGHYNTATNLNNNCPVVVEQKKNELSNSPDVSSNLLSSGNVKNSLCPLLSAVPVHMYESTPKRKVYKVVLTGGPCGGKTTGQIRLRTFFEGLGYKVYTVSEAATLLFDGGVKFEELDYNQAYQFQKDVIRTILCLESVYFAQAEMAAEGSRPILIICDRGAMDPSAYIDDESWKRMLKDLNLDQFSMREDRYDQVVHMTTAADGAQKYYTLANNLTRKESLEDAIKQDRKTRSAWLGHPRVDVIDNVDCKSFEDKILKLIAVVCDRMGLQISTDRLAFNSKKRKWLVRSFDENAMPRCEVFDVCHHYLNAKSRDVQVRLRSRSQNGRTTYTVTTRHFKGPGPVETRMQLTEREYENYLQLKDKDRAPINKERRCFMFGKQYFHIDIYKEPLPPSCKGQPLMILETYTTAEVGDENEPQLPSFMDIEREITRDSNYSMYNIAEIHTKGTSDKTLEENGYSNCEKI